MNTLTQTKDYVRRASVPLDQEIGILEFDASCLIRHVEWMWAKLCLEPVCVRYFESFMVSAGIVASDVSIWRRLCVCMEGGDGGGRRGD